MRISLGQIIPFTQEQCASVGLIVNSDGSQCVAPPAPAAASVGAPGLPTGYDPATGTVSSNPTGATQIPGYSNPDILTISAAQNASVRDQCVAAGGTFDSSSGLCSTNWTPYFVLGGVALLVIILAISGRR